MKHVAAYAFNTEFIHHLIEAVIDPFTLTDKTVATR